ncbi:hypothetical protein OC842_005067 [Tilletia horrida]|uniref:Uncharacterized protein n=1 Tax=Tilletia horrida TaxID=155126 RepID=A0AAN6GAU8_9BASI|nr:hypothetical protein OC842_005067 [Tilletia horrida]
MSPYSTDNRSLGLHARRPVTRGPSGRRASKGSKRGILLALQEHLVHVQPSVLFHREGKDIRTGATFIADLSLLHKSLSESVKQVTSHAHGHIPAEPLAAIAVTLGEQLETANAVRALHERTAQYKAKRDKLIDFCNASIIELGGHKDEMINIYRSITATIEASRQKVNPLGLPLNYMGQAGPESPPIRRQAALRRGHAHRHQEDDSEDENEKEELCAQVVTRTYDSRDEINRPFDNETSVPTSDINNDTGAANAADFTPKHDDAVRFSWADDRLLSPTSIVIHDESAEDEDQDGGRTHDKLADGVPVEDSKKADDPASISMPTFISKDSAAAIDAEDGTELDPSLLRRVSRTSAADSERTAFNENNDKKASTTDSTKDNTTAAIFEPAAAPNVQELIVESTTTSLTAAALAQHDSLEANSALEPTAMATRQCSIPISATWVGFAIGQTTNEQALPAQDGPAIRASRTEVFSTTAVPEQATTQPFAQHRRIFPSSSSIASAGQDTAAADGSAAAPVRHSTVQALMNVFRPKKKFRTGPEASRGAQLEDAQESSQDRSKKHTSTRPRMAKLRNKLRSAGGMGAGSIEVAGVSSSASQDVFGPVACISLTESKQPLSSAAALAAAVSMSTPVKPLGLNFRLANANTKAASGLKPHLELLPCIYVTPTGPRMPQADTWAEGNSEEEEEEEEEEEDPYETW